MTDPDTPTADWVTHVIQANGRDRLSYFTRRISNPDSAADLLGNLFVVIWRRKDSLPTDAEGARKWCFGIARNILREHRRGHARQIALADTLRAQLEITAQRYAADPSRAAEQREQNIRLHTALRRLDARSQELVTLIHWDAFNITDAAEHLGMNPSSTQTRYSRARSKLAHLLDEDAPHQAGREPGKTTRPVQLRQCPNVATEDSHD